MTICQSERRSSKPLSIRIKSSCTNRELKFNNALFNNKVIFGPGMYQIEVQEATSTPD
jgi:hypothetical protein